MEINANSRLCELFSNTVVNAGTFILKFNWQGPPPAAGQFFMLKPQRSSLFLPRPFSIFEYDSSKNILSFLIVKAGKGTEELSLLKTGEKVRLTGPLGNAWADFLPESVLRGGGKAALVGGGAGVAPLAALVSEKSECQFDFFAGFKNGFRDKEEENAMLGGAVKAKKVVITAENGMNALGGVITDYLFNLKDYDAVYGCGSLPMLKALKEKCEKTAVTCYISMENRMACGTGACLGCSIRTVKGNRRCCADGPIFPAQEIIFYE